MQGSSKPPPRSPVDPDPDPCLNGENITYIENLYEAWIEDPGLVDAGWRSYFTRLESAPAPAATTAGTPRHEIDELSPNAAGKQAAVMQLINAHRIRGHQVADIDPLGLADREPAEELELSYFGLSAADLDTEFNSGSLFGPEQMKLSGILEMVRGSYCGSVGWEFMHITSTDEKRWLQSRIEPVQGEPEFSATSKKTLLQRLSAAEGLERYLHTRYVGQKRFSLEGGESVIPILDELVQRSGALGIKELVLGMAHRGRLNVLVNVLGKSPDTLFSEFEGKLDTGRAAASGDVKYHQGFSSDIKTDGGPVHLALAFNPSHLEIVSPVAVGSVKARQLRRKDARFERVLPVSVHGDAAFAGQGVVMETFNMAECRGYRTGGTIHVVINNQIGFTTSHSQDARSTPYCTDVAKMVDTPIFHVNGDDPEAVIFVTRLALDYRMAFNKDVVIDLVCYRRHGHNEADEPSVTQPMMYKTVRALKTTRTLYAEKLIDEGFITAKEDKDIVEGYRSSLESGEIVVEDFLLDVQGDHMVDWSPFTGGAWHNEVDTSIALGKLRRLAADSLNIPEDFELHPRAEKINSDRRKMAAGEMPLDWGMAENLAYASLLKDDFSIRISGQDSGRGTFSHRHAVLHNMANRDVYIPLQHLFDGQPGFRIIDSLLSEEAVLAFEYGFATADPHTLVVWEAQFGDFANGAQVVIDQFISSGEAKWGRLCGLTMFLPHGYEGQGPEHSSARLERFLQLCADHNIQVCVPTTPAQMYHMLRRQMIRPYRKPLVVMTPKSLLRHKLSVSSMEELADGKFCNILPEVDDLDVSAVTRVILCSGKVYFDLLQERRNRKQEDVALVRVEQLYPFPREEVTQAIRNYSSASEVSWCQEEPLNQGAWYQVKHHLAACVPEGLKLVYAGREAAASPACGYYSMHQEQQTRLVDEALSPLEEDPPAQDEVYTLEKRHVS